MGPKQKLELREKISKEIHSDKSPVGIDAKKTHILILMELAELKEEMKELKDLLKSLKENS